jgi:ZIP family zinc transporter
MLRPGEIELTVRNDGPDAVGIAQASVNEAFVPFSTSDGARVERLGSTTVTIPYDWVEGEGYAVTLLTSTGGTVEHEIPVAVETPEADAGFFGLMALLGIYVGVIPVSLGMLWLPFVRRVGAEWLRVLIAFTIGLLAFLAIDAALEGLEIADAGPGAFGGSALVFVGALIAYLALAGVDAYLARRRAGTRTGGAVPAAAPYVALLVAIGIGLHNLGEGLAIGSAYAAGALALGTFLVVGFAIHNTTEGLAIVAPLASARPSLGRLATLGLVAGAPAILGAWIGAAAFNPSAAALLFGIGVGAIARVIVQLAPSMRDGDGRLLHPGAVGGLLAGIAVLYLTGLLVAA